MGFRKEYKTAVFLGVIANSQTQALVPARHIELWDFEQWKETVLKGYLSWYVCTCSLIKNKQTNKQTNKLKTGLRTTVVSPELTDHLVSLMNLPVKTNFIITWTPLYVYFLATNKLRSSQCFVITNFEYIH